MKQSVIELMERGQINQIKKFWDQTPNCRPTRAKGKPLSLHKLASLFTVVIFGSLFALGASLIEKCFEKCHKKKSNKCCFIMKKKMVLKNLENSLKECGESLRHENSSENHELLYMMDNLLSKYEFNRESWLYVLKKINDNIY